MVVVAVEDYLRKPAAVWFKVYKVVRGVVERDQSMGAHRLHLQLR